MRNTWHAGCCASICLCAHKWSRCVSVCGFYCWQPGSTVSAAGKELANNYFRYCAPLPCLTCARVCVWSHTHLPPPLLRWNFRRIEDICWIKTNKRRDTEPDRKYLSAQHQDPHSTLVHTKVCTQTAPTLSTGASRVLSRRQTHIIMLCRQVPCCQHHLHDQELQANGSAHVTLAQHRLCTVRLQTVLSSVCPLCAQ